ncbi:MAG: hypothetical protein WCD21_06495 [Streptomyces sp.]
MIAVTAIMDHGTDKPAVPAGRASRLSEAHPGGGSSKAGATMGYQPTGFTTPFFGITGQWTRSDREVAVLVMNFLRGRRVLRDYGREREPIEIEYCLASARRCRETLSEYLDMAKPGRALAEWIDVLRGAFMDFEQAAGPDGARFVEEPGKFREALERLRETVRQGSGFVAKKAKVADLSS